MAKNVFNSVKGLHPKRNSFSAHTYRNDFTAQLGLNIPVYVQHVVPNTRVKCSASALIRLQALIAPVMDNIDFYVHFWQIPYRLLENDKFTKFISGEIDAAEYDALFVTPYYFAQTYFINECAVSPLTHEESLAKYESLVGNGGLLDFLGYDRGLFPTVAYDDDDDEWVFTGGNKKKKFNYRAIFAYLMLLDNWYANENIPYFEHDDFEACKNEQSLTRLVQLLGDLIDDFGYSMAPHGWEKDYFTSGLPNVQFGNPVTLPIAGTANAFIDPQDVILSKPDSYGSAAGLVFVYSGEVSNGDNPQVAGSPIGPSIDKSYLATDVYLTNIEANISGKEGVDHDQIKGQVDLSEATAITINELRFANALQVFKERQMRYGRRRQEYYKGFFDVVPEDLRLQLPKYIGGGLIPINIADIEQTSATDGSQALGRLAGKATAVAGGFAGFSTFCSEESIIIGIGFAMPHITYAQSTSRFLFKTNDVYDYFNPSFEHLGEQAILKGEIFAGAGDDFDKEFAYTPRYNEYRFHNNEMHGSFKDSLAFWTLGRIFENTPALNKDFVYMQPAAFDRIFAVSGQDNMMSSMLFRQRIVQPVSKYGTPMLLA